MDISLNGIINEYMQKQTGQMVGRVSAGYT